MAELGFVAPTSVEEAVGEAATEGVIALAGGTALVARLQSRSITPNGLVYLGRVASLATITTSHGALRLGATVTMADLARSQAVRDHAPALALAASHVGNSRVRASATVGGAVSHADSRQDLLPVLIALGATAELQRPTGIREVPLAGFFAGFMQTVAQADELITEVVVPVVAGRRCAYRRMTPGSQDDYPTVGVAATVTMEEDGSICGASVVLCGVGSTPVSVDAVRVLVGTTGEADLVEGVAQAAAKSARPVDDRRGSAAYKRDMAAVWTRRALSACLGR